MYKVDWYCDVCGDLMRTFKHENYDRETNLSDVVRQMWSVPNGKLNSAGLPMCTSYLVCERCRYNFFDPKSPEATSRPAD